MSRTIVERLSRVVDRRASRRGFLSRSAMGATALAVAPAAYALRPTTAHAAICSCNGLDCDCANGCCDGYTDFCCFLTGENLCPPGSTVAGWWKADGSGFCDLDGPRPRYYLDCNLPCGDCGCEDSGVCSHECADADCRCPDGCHSRAVECTRFRYGQCNQDVQCVGPIQCRIVTCVAPWEWDPSCTTEVATDNQTAFHDRPCLHDGFTDVAPYSWYTDPVGWMVDERITTGLTSDLFGPHENATRAQIATFLWRYRGEPPVPEGASSPFGDVPEGEWYTQAVRWMVHAGLTTGTSDTTFDPARNVTRGETVTFLWRLAGRPGPDPDADPIDFSDVPPSRFYADAVAWAASVGVTQGMGSGTFGGETLVTRAQVATFLHRYHQLSESLPR